MGIPERKRRQRQDLRQQVLNAAEELFVKDGYSNVSMRKIAEKIEYSPTMLYRLFRNKADIMDHLIADGYSGVYQRYEEILTSRPDSPWETLNLIIAAYVRFALEHPSHYELWFASSQLQVVDGQLRMRHGDTSYRVYRFWLELIEECKTKGLFSEKAAIEVFQLIWGPVHGLISLRIHHPRFPWMSLEQHLIELLSLLNNGLFTVGYEKSRDEAGN